MNNLDYQRLLETAWRRPLSREETARLQTWLATHPEARAKWESEPELTGMLGRLPDVPVPSNFTALVLQSVDREGVTAVRLPLLPRIERLVRRAIPRWGWAFALAGLVGVAYYQHQLRTREQMTRGLLQYVAAAGLKDPSVFSEKDLEAILLVGQMSPADVELDVALRQPSP